MASYGSSRFGVAVRRFRHLAVLTLVVLLVCLLTGCDHAPVGESVARNAGADDPAALDDAGGGGADEGAPEGSAGSGSGDYGAGKTGPAAERCETDGTRVSKPSQIRGKGVFLLAGGRYGSLSVPAGATVKPYDCAQVTIDGTVKLGNGATLAGVTVRSDADWVMRIAGRDITIRNNTVNGGTIEAIRIYDGARNIDVVGNNIDGGRNHHTLKVISESGGAHPTDIRIHNNRFSKRYYGTAAEDLVQLEGHDEVVLTNNTFEQNPRGEDGLDVKDSTGGILVEGNDFRGDTIAHECLMVAGNRADNIVRDNRFSTCDAISLGAGYNQWPWWRFQNNELRDSQLRVRQSDGAEVIGNDMVGGTLTVGIPNENDMPRNLTLKDNRFDGVRINNNLRSGIRCAGNLVEGLTRGASLGC